MDAATLQLVAVDGHVSPQSLVIAICSAIAKPPYRGWEPAQLQCCAWCASNSYGSGTEGRGLAPISSQYQHAESYAQCVSKSLAQDRRLRDAGEPATLGDLAHLAELLLRSLNGLQERLHHSYALYALLSADRFVTVEVYVIPLACLIAVLPLQVRSAPAQGLDHGFSEHAMQAQCHSTVSSY